MNVVSALFWGIIVLSLLVVVHEGGHFLAARACGIRVTEFFLGMPCRYSISRRSKKYGTIFGITPILLGGYNRICGMEGPCGERTHEVLACIQRDGKTTSARIAAELNRTEKEICDEIATLADWAIIQDVGTDVIDAPDGPHECAVVQTLRRDARLLTEYDAGHDFTRPGSTAEGEPRPIEDVQAFLATERSHTYEGKGFLQRLLVLIAGPAVNIVLALLLVVGTLMASGYTVVVDTNVVSAVEAESYAAKAGLQAGDALVEIKGQPCESWQDVSASLQDALRVSQPFEIRYERKGQLHRTTVDIPEDGSVTALGVYATTQLYHPSFGEAALTAINYGWLVASSVAQLIMPQHMTEILSQSSSVVGISVMASQAAQSGIIDLIVFVAAVSMSLGFMNLLPIPPLDGGKIMIEFIQLLLRRPLSLRARSAVSYLGLAFFLAIFLFTMRNDIVRFVLGQG